MFQNGITCLIRPSYKKLWAFKVLDDIHLKQTSFIFFINLIQNMTFKKKSYFNLYF
jgi:hypothetical protein